MKYRSMKCEMCCSSAQNITICTHCTASDILMVRYKYKHGDDPTV
jgi:hypothetical protein